MLVETKPYSNRKVVIPGRLEIHAADDAARFILRIAPEKLA
ncbi:sarcosine oxidase subunit gamma, partial [Salmonella enterica subsp. enterica serovar Alachua]|nr:sarcosine oxidase subunit gamma [Salmonella enterica subsp. enterica serovar Alachua]